jgi:hypothetical protein
MNNNIKNNEVLDIVKLFAKTKGGKVLVGIIVKNVVTAIYHDPGLFVDMYSRTRYRQFLHLRESCISGDIWINGECVL